MRLATCHRYIRHYWQSCAYSDVKKSVRTWRTSMPLITVKGNSDGCVSASLFVKVNQAYTFLSLYDPRIVGTR